MKMYLCKKKLTEMADIDLYLDPLSGHHGNCHILCLKMAQKNLGYMSSQILLRIGDVIANQQQM